MSYKIHTKFYPSKPRQDWELYNYYFSVVMGKSKMWPSEAWCGASWKKQKQKTQVPTEKENMCSDGNGLGPLESNVGFGKQSQRSSINSFGKRRAV